VDVSQTRITLSYDCREPRDVSPTFAGHALSRWYLVTEVRSAPYTWITTCFAARSRPALAASCDAHISMLLPALGLVAVARPITTVRRDQLTSSPCTFDHDPRLCRP
jgi:hypothetical protein